MKLVIKNLVCPCCTAYVADVLKNMKVGYDTITPDGVNLTVPMGEAQLEDLDQTLRAVGLEIVYEKKNIIVEKIKSMVGELARRSENPLKVNLSVYLSEALRYNYSYLSNMFSESEGITIREYAIQLRIERVKRMLTVEDLELLEISYVLNYSSVSHLAAQFKKVTGLTTTEFKRIAAKAEPIEVKWIA